MKEYFMICFRGCLNGKRVLVDLLVIELILENKETIPPMFKTDLISCLYDERGKRNLGQKNGPGTSGWLDVLKIDSVPHEARVIKVNNSDVNEVYKIIKPHLKKEMDQKIKIGRKVKKNV